MTPFRPESEESDQVGTSGTVRFGPFELDTRSGELRDGTTRVRLQEQPFAILRLLLERPGELVSRDELRDRLWPGGTFVDFEHSLNAAVKRLRTALGDVADSPRFIETLPRRGYRFVATVARSESDWPSQGVRRLPRLAVLPLSSLSGEAEREYFGDGLTEEMITQLGQLCRGRLAVIARASSMTFKGSDERARTIGEALGADYLLEGSVRREGDRARITARLVEVSTETQLWAETYQRHLTDTLSVQVEVATRIARSLAMEFVPRARRQRDSSISAAAYQEYLKGRYYWNKLDDDRQVGSASALEQALSCFTNTIAVAPSFAPAHAIAAQAYIARAQQYLAPPRPELEAARVHARRAVELDPDVAEAYLALADVLRMLDWDWRGAEAAYRHAIALNPNLERVHRRYSLMLAVRARAAEAMEEAELACELDPCSLFASLNAALILYLAGHAEQAIQRCSRIIDVAPEYLAAKRLIGAAYLDVGRTQEALEQLADVQAQGMNAPVATAWLAHAAAVSGDRSAAERWRARLPLLGADRYVSPYHLALAHTGAGAFDLAFASLEQARADNDPALAYLAVEPRLRPLRSDPRYARLLEQVGLS